MICSISKRLRRLLQVILVPVVAAGCQADSLVADGGMSGTGISSGTISGFGSIHSGGVIYDTSSAALVFNGGPGAESQFRTGMIVQVNGTINNGGKTGVASQVSFNYKLVGLVDPDAANQPPSRSTHSVSD